MKEMLVNNERLENVPELYHQGNMLSAGVGCELAAGLVQFRQLLPFLTFRNLPLLTEVGCIEDA